MQTRSRKMNKLNNVIAIVLIVLMTLFYTCVNCTNKVIAATETIQPDDDQYLELRAVSIDDVTGQNKQVIMELWSHNLDYKGFEVTFAFDSTLFQTSNIETNVITEDETEYFKFEDEFNSKVDLFVVGGTSADVLDMTFALNTPINSATTHIVSDGSGGYKITTDEVLIGKLSFQMPDEGVFSIEGFHLVTNDYTPQTGIKIDKSLTECYQKQSTFRFTDETASRNAYLSNLIVSSGVVDEDVPENSTYKTYALTPTFDKDEFNYEFTLLEYKDKLDVKAILEDDTATMKIKVPKRDDNDELEYEGAEIKYEEKTLDNDTPLEVAINKLGEPNTKITILVIAEDGVTKNEYTVTIKRPYGLIKGSVQLGNGLRDDIQASYGVYVKYIANCTLYEAGKYDWDGIVPGTFSLDELNDEEYETRVVTDEDDGSYEMYVIPGTYDFLIEKLGFLADITTNMSIAEGEVIDLGNKILIEGDTDRNGIIELDDIIKIVEVMDSAEGDDVYETYYDFGNKGFVSFDDLVSAVSNCDQLVTVTPY